MIEGKGQPPKIRVKSRASTGTSESCRDCMIDHTHLMDRGDITADDY